MLMSKTGRLVTWGAILTLLALLSAACGPRVRTLAPPPPEAELDFGGTLESWTRSARIYENFETNVVVHATYFSHEFIGAYLQEYERLYRPLPAEAEALENKLNFRKLRKECFFVALFTGERDWNDLSLPNSVWRVHLENDQGSRARAATISEVESRDVAHRHFFPYCEAFFDAYLVCFERYPRQEPGASGLPQPLLRQDIGAFRLTLRSPVGNVELSWELGER